MYLRVLGKDVAGVLKAVCHEVKTLLLEILVEKGHIAASSQVVDVNKEMCFGCHW